MKKLLSLVALMGLLSFVGCGGGDGDTAGGGNTSGSQDLAGTWSGTMSDSQGPNTITWTASQTGSRISGNVVFVGQAGSGTGTMSGDINGTTLSFSINVPVGSAPYPYNRSDMTMSGTATVSGSTMVGTYSGYTTLVGPIQNGQISLQLNGASANAPSGSNPIIGQWRDQERAGRTYTFSADGTLTQSDPDLGITTGTWSTSGGIVTEIWSDGRKASWQYSVSGNELTYYDNGIPWKPFLRI